MKKEKHGKLKFHTPGPPRPRRAGPGMRLSLNRTRTHTRHFAGLSFGPRRPRIGPRSHGPVIHDRIEPAIEPSPAPAQRPDIPIVPHEPKTSPPSRVSPPSYIHALSPPKGPATQRPTRIPLPIHLLQLMHHKRLVDKATLGRVDTKNASWPFSQWVNIRSAPSTVLPLQVLQSRPSRHPLTPLRWNAVRVLRNCFPLIFFIPSLCTSNPFPKSDERCRMYIY